MNYNIPYIYTIDLCKDLIIAMTIKVTILVIFKGNFSLEIQKRRGIDMLTKSHP